MPRTIYLVSCVGQKRAQPSPAGELYTSDWFRKAAAYAEERATEHGAAWYILSAKYELVAPDQILAPYDETLNRMPASARRNWARRVLDELRPLVQPGDTVVFLAGARYREGLVEPLRELGCRVEIPMEGLRIGEQLRNTD